MNTVFYVKSWPYRKKWMEINPRTSCVEIHADQDTHISAHKDWEGYSGSVTRSIPNVLFIPLFIDPEHAGIYWYKGNWVFVDKNYFIGGRLV